MLYKKNGEKTLSDDLFQNPTSEYRGAPFWAWNDALDPEELKKQLEMLKQMGFGGAHMHVRTGMATPYLSDAFLNLIRTCVDKAASEDMLAWLYDEDRWPSGAAGGLVTRDDRYRSRYLQFMPAYDPNLQESTLLACYDIRLDEAGGLLSSRIIGKDEPAAYEKWYAVLTLRRKSPWYNNESYVNTLDKAAIDRFIELTYESYKRTVSDAFDQTVPAIFTDEPQFYPKSTLRYSTEKDTVTLPWTDDLADTFAKAYPGEDLMEGLPELIWERADRKPSVLRYHYHDHVCDRFVEAFADNCGAWCRKNGLKLTGHMMEEPTLYSQTRSLGETMRSYRAFDLPGIDMLCALFEYTTAKQAASAVHQYAREGMMSELYGVTGYDFDFRGHKLHGDWQAALGVTIRVPHLSWYSMRGEAKRDYPASIHYQSPWWKEYHRIEDHFARVNTALTRGKPLVRVGVIHPVESYWLHWGPANDTALVRNRMDEQFQQLTEWLLFGSIDFDFISESLLPELAAKPGAPMKVGAMAYDAILVPECETLRSTTLERLESFRNAGGKLIFLGALPTLENAVESDRGKLLADRSEILPFTKSAVLEALEPYRLIEIRDEKGSLTSNLLSQIREDGSGRWIFIAHGKEPYNKDISRHVDARVRIKGRWDVTIYDSLTGKREKASYRTGRETTEVFRRLYDYDSLLMYLSPAAEAKDHRILPEPAGEAKTAVPIPAAVPFTLSEPNVLLLDQAEFALDDGPLEPKEEILRLDECCRKRLGWPSRKASVAQPWAIEEEPVTHTLRLLWRIRSDIALDSVSLAMEDADKAVLTWNGRRIENRVTGYYTDRVIQTVLLPGLIQGENVLEAEIPFGKRTNTEWVYLTGNFGVSLHGRNAVVTKMPDVLAFDTITTEGLPFYGGNVTYHIPVDTPAGNLIFRSSRYRGSLQTVSLDGKEAKPVIYPPYTADLGPVEAGRHVIDVTLYGSRGNAFGPVHLADAKETWIGPTAWRTEGEKWCYEYCLSKIGILSSPVVTI